MQNTINIDITTKLFFSASFQFQIYNIDNNNIDYTRLFNNIDYTRLAHNEYSGIVWYQFVFWNSLVLVSVLEQYRTQCILKQSGTSKYSETVWHNEYFRTVWYCKYSGTFWYKKIFWNSLAQWVFWNSLIL